METQNGRPQAGAASPLQPGPNVGGGRRRGIAAAVIVVVLAAAGYGIFRMTRTATPTWGASSPIGLVTTVMQACEAGNTRGVALLWTGAPNVQNYGVMEKWCAHVTMDGTAEAWEIDGAPSAPDAAGLTVIYSRTWLDTARTQPGKRVQWWLRQESGRWVLVGGL